MLYDNGPKVTLQSKVWIPLTLCDPARRRFSTDEVARAGAEVMESGARVARRARSARLCTDQADEMERRFGKQDEWAGQEREDAERRRALAATRALRWNYDEALAGYARARSGAYVVKG